MDIHTNEQARSMSPSLSAQTPGLDATSQARDMAMRKVAWMRENRALLVGVVGGLAAISVGTWLIVRARRPTRMELLRARGEDVLDWLRDLSEKIPSKFR